MGRVLWAHAATAAHRIVAALRASLSISLTRRRRGRVGAASWLMVVAMIVSIAVPAAVFGKYYLDPVRAVPAGQSFPLGRLVFSL